MFSSILIQYPLFDALEVESCAPGSFALNSDEVKNLHEKLTLLSQSKDDTASIHKKIIISFIHHFSLKYNRGDIYGSSNTKKTRFGPGGFIFKIDLFPPVLQKIIYIYCSKTLTVEI